MNYLQQGEICFANWSFISFVTLFSNKWTSRETYKKFYEHDLRVLARGLARVRLLWVARVTEWIKDGSGIY